MYKKNFTVDARNPFSTFVKKREYTSDIYSSYSRNYGPKKTIMYFM